MANIFDEQDEQDEAQPATFELGGGYSSLFAEAEANYHTDVINQEKAAAGIIAPQPAMAIDHDNALQRGLEKARSSAGFAGQMTAGDYQGAAENIARLSEYNRANPGTPEGNQLMQAWETHAQQTGISGVSAGAGSISAGTVVFSNSNGFSFGLNGSTLTGSHNGLTTAALSNHSHGNPTLNLTNLSGTTASGSNGLTISLSASLGGGAGDGYNILAAGTRTASNGRHR